MSENDFLDDFNLIQKKKMENDNIDELRELMKEEGFIPVKKFKPDHDYTDLQIYIINPLTVQKNIRKYMEHYYPEKWYMRHVEQYGTIVKLFLTDDDFVDFNVLFNKKHIYYISEKPRKPINYIREIKKSDTRVMLEAFINQYQQEKERIEEEEEEEEIREQQLNDRIHSWLRGW